MKRRKAVPLLTELIKKDTGDILQIMKASEQEALNMERYLSWQELQYRKAPEGLTNEQWWIGIKLHRAQARQTIPLHSAKGKAFSFAPTQIIQQNLHRIDRKGGNIVMTDAGDIFCDRERDKYLLTSLEEEAIMSSMLEGAVVTRSEARQIIRDNRLPKDEHERMVMNNYLTMKMILENKDKPLTPAFILSLHRSMVEGTLKNPEKAGATRKESDNVCIEDVRTGDIVHMPPAAREIPERLEALCRFANGGDEIGYYIHPIIRAIILHFQLAYDHPFVDGNGRTARALFYWCMLKHGYWLFEFISISREIFHHARHYYEAFLNTEEDENDLNYFIINQLQTILSSINELMEHIRRKKQETDAFTHTLEHGLPFINQRQRQVLLNFIHHPDTHTSVTAHCRIYDVVRQTARTDLGKLEKLGFLYSENISREFIYRPKPNLEKLIKKAAAELSTPPQRG